MNYLVTGGTGFIGTYVVRDLIKEGHKVIAYDIAPNRNIAEQIIGDVVDKKDLDSLLNSMIVWGDINDLASFIQICEKYKVDKIIHTAALLKGSEDPYQMMQTNCGGTLNVFEAARILGMKRVVYCSSRAVFGPAYMYKEEYIPGNALYFPENVYGATKIFNEVSARQYFDKYKLDTIGIRFTHVYGYLRYRGRFAAVGRGLFIDPALGKPGIVPFGGSITNWIYVEDAARMLVMVSNVKETKTKIFSASGEMRSMADVAAYVKSLIPEADITLLDEVYRPEEKYDTTPLREEIGFELQWTMKKSVKKIIEYVRTKRVNLLP